MLYPARAEGLVNMIWVLFDWTYHGYLGSIILRTVREIESSFIKNGQHLQNTFARNNSIKMELIIFANLYQTIRLGIFFHPVSWYWGQYVGMGIPALVLWLVSLCYFLQNICYTVHSWYNIPVVRASFLARRLCLGRVSCYFELLNGLCVPSSCHFLLRQEIESSFIKNGQHLQNTFARNNSIKMELIIFANLYQTIRLGIFFHPVSWYWGQYVGMGIPALVLWLVSLCYFLQNICYTVHSWYNIPVVRASFLARRLCLGRVSCYFELLNGLCVPSSCHFLLRQEQRLCLYKILDYPLLTGSLRIYTGASTEVQGIYIALGSLV